MAPDRKIQYTPTHTQKVTQFGPRAAKWLKLVSWEDSWEPHESVREHAHLEADILAIDYAEARPAVRRPWPTSKDLCLTNLERQSFFDQDNGSQDDLLATEPHLRPHLQIETGQTVNPDLDILPTGDFTIAPAHTASATMTGQSLFVVHDPDGHALSTISEERVNLLHTEFCKHQNSHISPTPRKFALALAELLHRYKDGNTSGDHTISMKNHWATPQSLVKTIAEGLSARQERFACPLDFNPAFDRYYSPFREDLEFGAGHDAYSCRWTGSSQAHPEHTAKEMQKAVRWAIGSSLQSSKPCLTTFLLPFDEKSGTAYQQWLGHPAVYKIACLPKAAIRLQMPDAWKTGVSYDPHSRKDILLFAVGNTLGVSQYVNGMALEQGLQRFMSESRKTFAYDLPNPDRRAPTSMIHFYAPRGCSDELPDSDDVTRTREIIALPQEYTTLKPLKWRAEQIIYTDGSVRDTGEPEFYRSGTGVYRPPSDAGPCIQLCINPIGDRYGVANTIQRAEMVGVKHALSVAHTHSKRIIATDSLCAMYMISKHLRCPSLHKESKHLGILDAAVKAIAESLRAGQHIQIIKVKSHIGIKGNEEADRLAHDACETANCHQELLDGLPVREHIHWPIQKQPDMEGEGRGQGEDCAPSERFLPRLFPQSSPEAREDDTTMPDQQVNDLRKGLKALVRPKLATGYAKQTIYGEAWRAVSAHMLGEASNYFWKSATMPVVSQVLKYRFGQLWNMKLAYRMGRPYLPGWPMPRSANCPHCHQPDSGGHILGGCGHTIMKALYISRHDEAMRKVLRAINHGQKGSYLKIADIGRDELINDLGVVSKRIPTWLIPDDTLPQVGLSAHQRHVLRPDIMLIEVNQEEQARYTTQGHHEPLNGSIQGAARSTRNEQDEDQSLPRTSNRMRKIWVIEGGYTSDTRHVEKVQEKMEQHKTLLQALEAQGFDTRLAILTFGVGGTLYKPTKDALHDVGITPTEMKRLLKELHLHSIECLHNVVIQRRMLDSQALRHQTPRPP